MRVRIIGNDLLSIIIVQFELYLYASICIRAGVSSR